MGRRKKERQKRKKKNKKLLLKTITERLGLNRREGRIGRIENFTLYNTWADKAAANMAKEIDDEILRELVGNQQPR